MLNRIEEIYTSASIGIIWLEEPSVMTLEKSRAHRHLCILAFLFTKLVMLLNVAIHCLNNLIFRALILGVLERHFILIYHVEILAELVKFVLAKRCC